MTAATYPDVQQRVSIGPTSASPGWVSWVRRSFNGCTVRPQSDPVKDWHRYTETGGVAIRPQPEGGFRIRETSGTGGCHGLCVVRIRQSGGIHCRGQLPFPRPQEYRESRDLGIREALGLSGLRFFAVYHSANRRGVARSVYSQKRNMNLKQSASEFSLGRRR